jgi:hypothetical protein
MFIARQLKRVDLHKKKFGWSLCICIYIYIYIQREGERNK